MRTPAIKRMIIATATNVPATAPALEKNPLRDAGDATTVWTAGGGAVGVIVMVLI